MIQNEYNVIVRFCFVLGKYNHIGRNIPIVLRAKLVIRNTKNFTNRIN